MYALPRRHSTLFKASSFFIHSYRPWEMKSNDDATHAYSPFSSFVIVQPSTLDGKWDECSIAFVHRAIILKGKLELLMMIVGSVFENKTVIGG